MSKPHPAGPGPAGDVAERKLDAPQVRLRNEQLLLEMIWCERTISRAEIARRTGLSRSTVSAIVDALLDTGLVSFRGAGDSQGGRRPMLLGFDDDALGLVGVDLGASHVSVALTNLRAEVRTWATRPFPVRADPAGTLALAEALIREVLDAGHHDSSRLVGIGVGVPCPVSLDEPPRLSPRVLPAWEGHDIPGHLEAAFGRPVWLDNDANLGALAELWWGAGRTGEDLAYIKVGTGVGSGHILRGQIYRGASGVAGEIGHIVIDPGGPPCVCGLVGCLGTFVGAQALAERAAEALAAGRPSRLEPGHLSVSDIVRAALDGDEVARGIVARAGRHLGIALAGLVSLMNPATVVLGGGLVAAGELLLGPLRDTIARRTLGPSLDVVRVVAGELGEREVAIGAATLVLQAALADPALFPSVGPALRATG